MEVALYISKELSCKQIYVDVEYEDFVVVSLKGIMIKNSTIVGNFYRSPSSSAEANDRLLSVIDTLCSNYKCPKICLGDFNFPNIDWSLLTSKESESKKNDKYAAEKFFVTACGQSHHGQKLRRTT